jgi:hypothetical protein
MGTVDGRVEVRCRVEAVFAHDLHKPIVHAPEAHATAAHECPSSDSRRPGSRRVYNANGGIGTLVPGPATLEITLSWFDGTSSTVLDTEVVDITLVGGATIVNINVPEPSILIGESTSYTATLANPFATTLSSVFVQGYLEQGDITGFGAGGTTLLCSGQASGQLTPGTCAVSFSIGTRTIDGTPEWQEGPATFRLQLMQGNAVLDEKSVTVYLYRLR